MTTAEFPQEAQCTVEEAVLDGKDPFPDDEYQYVGQASNPHAVLNKTLKTLHNRLNGDGPEVEAVNVGDAGDLDGGTATAVLRHKFGATETPDFETHPEPMKALFSDEYAGGLVALPAAHRGYYPDPVETLEKVLDILEDNNATDIPVYFTDLGPNESNLDEYVKQFSRENPVLVRDHHNSFDEAMEAADEYVHDDSKCAAEIVLETDHPDAPDYLRELVEGPARVRDLWLDDHPKFIEYGVYGDAHFGLGDWTFERLAAAHGKALVDLPVIGDELRAQTGVKEAKIAYAVENAEFHEVEAANGESVTIALAMGDVYTSEVGRRLYTEGYREQAADLVAIAKPSGSASLRSHDDFPHAFTVANALGGGGHDCAAGFESPADSDAPLDVKAKIVLAEVAGVIRDTEV